MKNIAVVALALLTVNAFAARLATYPEVMAVSNQVQTLKQDWQGSVAYNITAADTQYWAGAGTEVDPVWEAAKADYATTVFVTNAIDIAVQAIPPFVEADTLATVAERGGFAGTEEIAPLRVLSQCYGGPNSGFDATGDGWVAIGINAGSLSAGAYWSALGVNSGYGAVGDTWSSVGYYAGQGAYGSTWLALGYEAGKLASGDEWIAVGQGAGLRATGSAWVAVGPYTGIAAAGDRIAMFGAYAGYRAVGADQLFVDVYGTSPGYTVGGATNDMIWGREGYLSLGRGPGAPGGAKGGNLRGSWTLNGDTVVSVSNPTFVAAANIRSSSNNWTGVQVFNTNVTFNAVSASANPFTISLNGVPKMYINGEGEIVAAAAGIRDIGNGWALGSSSLRQKSTFIQAWSATTGYGTETTISRKEAYMLQIGTGAVANAYGSLEAKNYRLVEPRWQDVVASGAVINPNAANAPERVETASGSGVYGSGWSVGDNQGYTLQFPHGVAEVNTAFPNFYYNPHLHVASTASSLGSSNATFVIKLLTSAPYDGGYGTVITRTNTVSMPVANVHYICDFGNVTNNALSGKDSTVSKFTIYRVAGASDVGANEVLLDSPDYHVPIREIGSVAIMGD